MFGRPLRSWVRASQLWRKAACLLAGLVFLPVWPVHANDGLLRLPARVPPSGSRTSIGTRRWCRIGESM